MIELGLKDISSKIYPHNQYGNYIITFYLKKFYTQTNKKIFIYL